MGPLPFFITIFMQYNSRIAFYIKRFKLLKLFNYKTTKNYTDIYG